MDSHGLLQELVLVYAVAVVLLVIGARLRVPAIVSMIAAGVIAGPNGMRLMTSQEDVDFMAEIGVALLLFTAGLEFSLNDLRRMWRTLVPGGLGQVALTVLVTGGAVFAFAGGPVSRIVVIGLVVALSSTAVVLKELARRNQLHSPHGRLTVGVLLLQDIVVIAVLAAAPALFGGSDAAGAESQRGIGRALVTLAAVGGGVLLIGRVLLPRLLRIAAASSREAFALSVVLASVGTAFLAAQMGLSMAAGAFLAGLILAEGEFSHQVHADVRPLRDLLASLFFVSVGMLIDVREMLPLLHIIVLAAAAIVIAKTAMAAGALMLTGAPIRIALAAAFALAQVGEFSFVLGRAALEGGVISTGWWQVLLGSSVITMALTPFLIAAGPGFATRLAPRRTAVPESLQGQRDAMRDHVVILGYGIGGRLLAQSLGELSVPYVVLELNGATVRSALARGVNIHYADVSAPEPLEAAGVKHAAAVVLVLSDPDASERAVKAVRAMAPQVPIIARTRYRLEAERLATAGATLAVAEELEASLEVMSQLLARLHIPGNVVETLVDNYRRVLGASTGRPSRAPAIPMDQMPREIMDAPVSSFRLAAESWAVGKSLQDVDLRNSTGATVIAVRRASGTTTSPPAVFELAADDDLFLLGDDSDILLARALMAEGPRARVSSVGKTIGDKAPQL
ncbi:MAG TPA: cation:proton antiporter [Vicinamibacterales bacterium]|nr:cation:proton antiporter [Vicinamibacterales bacterium]